MKEESITGLKRSLKLPTKLDEDGLLLGWSLENVHPKIPLGFSFGHTNQMPNTGYVDPILYHGDGHIMTIAPTGAGKGTGCVIPALLRYSGPVIVVDPKGENVAVTARRRREMGHRVIVLDPLNITDFESDSLNPFDLINSDSALAIDDVAALVELTSLGQEDPRNMFWINRGKQLLVGMAMHLVHSQPPEKRTFEALRKMVNQGDEALVETAKEMMLSSNPDVRTIAAALMIPAPETLGGYLAHAQENLEFARGPLIAEATGSTSFSLDDITRGDPLSIFIVIPPDKLESHSRLLRVWIGTLMSAIVRRRAAPDLSTLFILDEAAQLGQLPQLRQAITLLRGYGMRTWSFWQDASQLRHLYPSDWQTMVNNCKVQMSFGSTNMSASRQVAELTGSFDAASILDLEHHEMVLLIAGDEAVIAQKPSYLTDPVFAGHFDANPLHDKDRDIMPTPPPAPKPYERPKQDKGTGRREKVIITKDELMGRPRIDKAGLRELLGTWE